MYNKYTLIVNIKVFMLKLTYAVSAKSLDAISGALLTTLPARYKSELEHGSPDAGVRRPSIL